MNMHNQKGLSLVELMVALAVSSFLILGITQVYINNKRNYVFQQSQAANLDSSRFAVLLLDELLSKAGYRRTPDQEMNNAFPGAHNLLSSHCSAFPEGAAITKLKNSGDIGFCLRYQPATRGEDLCDGNTSTLEKEDTFLYPGLNETIYLAIQYTPHPSEQAGSISCHSSKGSSSELLDGIADMKIEFGNGFEEEKRLKANGYKNSTDWAVTDGTIRAVRYSVLTASRPNQRDGDSVAFDQWISSTASATSRTRLQERDSRHLYQAAVGSQAVRNMMP
ncbi:MAG: prepilin-type N-terminal cleavage/methylation domain-containing protein [Thiopseudomonas sp.]